MSLFGSSKTKKPSLFSGATPAPTQHHKFDIGAALAGFFGVPASVFINRRAGQDAEAQQQQLNAIIDADQDLSPQDKAYAKLNPKAYIDARMTRYQTRTLAPNDEIATPTVDPTKPQIYRSGAAPSETERTAAYFESIGRKDLADAYRAKQATTVVQGVDASTGQPIVQGLDPRQLFPGSGPPPTAPRVGQAPGTLTDDDIRRMEQGGAGQSAPRTFPF